MRPRLRRPRSLTARITLTVVVLVALLSVLVVTATTVAVGSYLVDRLDEDLEAAHARSVRAVDFVVSQPGPPPTRPSGPPPDIREVRGQEVGTLTAHYSGDDAVGQVIDADAELGPLDKETLRTLEEAAPGRSSGPIEVELPGLGTYRVLSDSTDVAGGEVRVVTGLPTSAVDEIRRGIQRWGLLFGVAGTVLGGATAVGVVRRQTRPLREVAATAHAVAATELATGEISLGVRVPERMEDPDTEVGQVASALNMMLGHVESALDSRHRSEQQARQLLADVSHELRTPLATIAGYAELGLKGQDPDGVTHALGKVQTEAGRMTTLVEDLLLLARLEAGRGLAVEEVDLSRMVMESVADARITGPDHHWVMGLPDAPVVVTGDELRLHQVLGNLLANARRHTPAGCTVTTSLRLDADAAVVMVADDGPGIDPDLVGEVFSRFTRGDEARTRASSGAGLGLSLARSIARAQGGDLAVESGADGTVFRLELPRS